MSPFRADEKTRIVEGRGRVDSLGALAKELGASRVWLTSDPGVARAGHAECAERSLREAGLEVAAFDEVAENPSTLDVARGLDSAAAFAPDCFVAVGGGSAIDAAKGVNFLLTNGGRMQDYWGHDTARVPLIPSIAVPTTAGTGSEVQSYALITDAESGRKMACGDPSAAPRIAVLDAELTLSMPAFVTACTGLDALSHALESAVTTRRNARSAEYSREASRGALRALPRVLEEPGDLDARTAMLRAAALGGLAIEHSMLGAAHSMANPLTARFGLPHGQAVSTMLPHVIRFNAERPEAREVYAALARDAGLANGGVDAAAAEALASEVERILELAGLPRALAAHGVARRDLAQLASESAQQWTAAFNPRPVDAAAFERLLAGALGGGDRG